MGSDRIGTKLNPRMGFRYQLSVLSVESIFNFFGPAVRIIQDGKSPVRSDAYFPEWKQALSQKGLSYCIYTANSKKVAL